MPWGGASSPPPPQLLTHGFTLRDLLGAATRDDLFYTGMRCPPGGGRGTTWGDASLGPPPAPYPPPQQARLGVPPVGSHRAAPQGPPPRRGRRRDATVGAINATQERVRCFIAARGTAGAQPHMCGAQSDASLFPPSPLSLSPPRGSRCAHGAVRGTRSVRSGSSASTQRPDSRSTRPHSARSSAVESIQPTGSP